ncbi:MAG TPA: hypothetical protein PKW30_04480 [Campylobacterales bacterium]|nr:hypothetical protein [Campylobacterales bacterium]
MKKIFFAATLSLSATFLFAGEYEDGMLALQKKEFEQAAKLFEKGSQNGNVEAKNALAKLYLGFFDKGHKKDIQKARALARESAQAGNAEGMYLVFTAFSSDPEFSFLENGKVDYQKYETLRKRSIKDRALDIEAYDMLMRSARKNYGLAILILGVAYYESIGENNNKKALNIARAIGPSMPMFEQIRQKLELVNKLGDTRATFKLLVDAQPNAMMAAMVNVYGISKADKCEAKNVKLVKVNKIGEVEGAEYLPLKEAGMEKVFLISGKWQENWTYDVCGKETVVPMEFTADGNKGAYFKTQLALKN